MPRARLSPAWGIFIDDKRSNCASLFPTADIAVPELMQMKSFHGMLGVLCGIILAGCSQSLPELQALPSDASRQNSIEQLIAAVRADSTKKPLLAMAVMSGKVLVIPDPGSKSLALLWFDQPERSFIPVFSSRKVFDQEAYGTGFEGKAISIDASRFASLLQGDEVVILNSGHRPAIEFKASDLKALVNH
jgi:hypothetical protein